MMLEPRPVRKSIAQKKILIVDDSERFLYGARRQLLLSNFERVEISESAEAASAIIASHGADLILLDVHLGTRHEDGLEYLFRLRTAGFNGIVAIVSGDDSTEQFIRALKAGANDYLVKSVYLNIAEATCHLFNCARKDQRYRWTPETLAELCFLRTLGISQNELELLVEFARGFPRYRELAERIGRSETQVRKTFSRVFEKLNLKGPAQLAQLLTLCTLFEPATTNA